LFNQYSELIEITNELDVARATLEARKLAQAIGFKETEQYQISSAISELATNIYRYAKKGQIILKRVGEKKKKGIEVIAEDHGPGITDIKKALEEGFSTSKSLGIGLPGVKRLMDDFDIKSEKGKGTRVTVRKWI
jgi:serine/threonine-protein kinase RsbT